MQITNIVPNFEFIKIGVFCYCFVDFYIKRLWSSDLRWYFRTQAITGQIWPVTAWTGSVDSQGHRKWVYTVLQRYLLYQYFKIPGANLDQIGTHPNFTDLLCVENLRICYQLPSW